MRNAANTTIAVINGLQGQWLLDPGAVDMPTTVSTLLELVVKQLTDQGVDRQVPMT